LQAPENEKRWVIVLQGKSNIGCDIDGETHDICWSSASFVRKVTNKHGRQALKNLHSH
jgi:hypothetical protein